MDHRYLRSRWQQPRNLGNRGAAAADSGRESASLRVSVRARCYRRHLFRRFPLMVLFIIFCPIVAAILIMAGAPARKTALAASILAFAAALFLLVSFDRVQHDFQHVTSFSKSSEVHLSFPTGIDGLSLVMILLATIVTLAAIWFIATIECYENAFYAFLFFVSGRAIA